MPSENHENVNPVPVHAKAVYESFNHIPESLSTKSSTRRGTWANGRTRYRVFTPTAYKAFEIGMYCTHQRGTFQYMVCAALTPVMEALGVSWLDTCWTLPDCYITAMTSNTRQCMADCGLIPAFAFRSSLPSLGLLLNLSFRPDRQFLKTSTGSVLQMQ